MSKKVDDFVAEMDKMLDIKYGVKKEVNRE